MTAVEPLVQLTQQALAAEASGFRVAIVCMPFASAKIPSIQVGLISAIAAEAGFETDSYYFNLDLAKQLTAATYESLCEHRGRMAGEWLFAKAAFATEAPPNGSSFFRDFPEEIAWVQRFSKTEEWFYNLRDQVLPEFIEGCARGVDWSRYGVVGFSSTFQQNVACLALARRIKEGFPSVRIVFGGANMEGDMGAEYARAFPFIDFVVSGEADNVFPALLRSIAAKQTDVCIPGIHVRKNGNVRFASQAPPYERLDDSPIPHYAPYFDHVNELGLLDEYRADWALPVESSRGCWWGKKYHCTFCGLNGSGMSFRAKNADRFMDELTELARLHRISSFEAVDNILDLKYLPDLFARIEKEKVDYRFFYETKSNLTQAQVRDLYRGGVRCIQPGIESMSTHVLALMRKGCTMLQNVRLLKWCLYYNIKVGWNLLYGFPGETEADYQQQMNVLASIRHLEPPKSICRIWLERFSPYFFDREHFPVANVRPQASYRYVYPRHVDLEKIAYFFDYDMGDTLSDSAHKASRDFVAEWQKAWSSGNPCKLFYRRTSDGLMLDYSSPERSGSYDFSGPLALIYEYCVETMRTPKQVVEHLRLVSPDYAFPEEEVRDALEEFCNGRLMVSEEGKYLSLAVPTNPNW